LAKPEWGIKRICPGCGTRYYDFHKDPPLCPACNTVFDPEALLRSRRTRVVPTEDLKPAPVKTVKEAPVDESDDTDLEVEIEEESDTVSVEELQEQEEEEEAAEEDEDVLLEDASELGEDDDDVGEVVDVDDEDSDTERS